MEKQKNFCWGCLRSCQMMSTVAITPMPTNSQRCQPSWLARKENAAPVLWARTRLKKLVMGAQSPYSKMFRIHCLVIWSTKISSAAQISQGQ